MAVRRAWVMLATAFLLAACGGPAAPTAPAPQQTSPESSSTSAVSTPSPAPSPPALDILSPALPSATIPAPRPVLGALAFPTIDDGWAAASTQILHTTDGGRTWQAQFSAAAPVQSVAFVSPTQGWAAAGSHLYQTSDGGRTWAVIASAALDSLSFASPTDGWAIMTDPNRMRGFGPQTVLRHTADGGRTWADAPDPCGQDELTGVSFPTPGDGFILCTGQPGVGMQGKSVFATSDGGQSWKTVAEVQIGKQTPGLSSGGYAQGIVFRDPQHGYMLFGGGAGGGGVTRTVDGGADWSGVGGKGLQFAEFTNGAAFPTAEVGYIDHGNYGSDALFRTDDGGSTWTQVWPAPAVQPMVGQYLLAAGGSVYGFGPSGALVRSTDGGATWTAMGSAPNALSAATGQTLFALAAGPGGTNDLQVSPDGGRTWSLRPLSPQAPVPVAIGFDTPTDGLIVGRAGIYHTSDGGSSVTIVNASPPAIHQLNVVSAADAWAIGDGALDHSGDGGRTWQTYANPGGAPAMFVSFADPEHGMVLSGNSLTCVSANCSAVLLTTADGGRTWTSRSLPGVQATAFAMPSPGHAVLMTPIGVLRTADGGATWQWG